jgi:hypothetical protein
MQSTSAATLHSVSAFPVQHRAESKRPDGEHCTRCGAKWDGELIGSSIHYTCPSCNHGCRDYYGPNREL